MDKVKVNNQVVSMRKYVKQAKIRAINKCTKQIKFSENRKGNDEQMAKAKRKHQRLLEEVNLLKKIKPDSVSKLALSKTKDWKAVLAQKNVSLEERCFAMLANHPPVQEAVEKFHNENNELIAKIPELVKQWEGKKSRSSQIYKKNQMGKINNSNNSNTVPIGSKKNFQKTSKTLIKSQSTESLENLPDDSDPEKVKNDITERSLVITTATKRKELLNDLEPSSPSKKQLLAADDDKSDLSDDSFSDNSDFSNDESTEIEKQLLVEDKTKSIQNLKQSKVCAVHNSADKKMTHEIETKKSGNSDETIIKSNEEHSKKSQDIRSKLLEISKAKIVAPSESKNKSQRSSVETDSNEESSSDAEEKLSDCANVSARIKPLSAKVRNKMKAVTMLDLNELQDVDEIPIEKSDSDSEDETDEDSGKQKKDSFFLRDGEPVSESDEEENETVRKQGVTPFKKKPFGSYREQKDNSFQKRRFEKHSVNGRNSNFRDNSFIKNKKDFSFKDNKRNFKRTFDGNSDFRQNKNFKFTSKERFNNRNGASNFSRNPKEKPFSKNTTKDAKQNSHPSKSNLANFPKKNIADDKPLHPSWEAKRKLKEAANAKFQGKRVVFND